MPMIRHRFNMGQRQTYWWQWIVECCWRFFILSS